MIKTPPSEEGLRLRIEKPFTSDGTRRRRFAKWLARAAQILSGEKFIAAIPNTPSADANLAAEILRVRKVQNLGYRIVFSFLQRFPDAPFMHTCLGSHEKNEWRSVGFDFFSKAHAFRTACSETLERMLWQTDDAYWKNRSILSTYRDLRGAALDPRYLAGFPAAQKQIEPFAVDESSRLLWTKSLRLSNASELWVPTQLISGRHAKEAKNLEPLLRMPTSNGLATHRSFNEAAYSGLLELIERDAFMITFFNHISPPRVDPASIEDKKVRYILDELSRYRFTCEILLLPTDMPTHVVCCILRDETGDGPALAVGAKAHHDPIEALAGALTESFGVWSDIRRVGFYKKKLSSEHSNQLERLAFWAKKENAEKLSWLWNGPRVAMPKNIHRAQDARSLARAAEKNGCMVGAVLLSPPALKKLGIYSVCVVSSELQPLHISSRAQYLGGKRLESVPKLLGYPIALEAPPYPHPFP